MAHAVSRRPLIAPGSVHVGFVLDKMATGQVYLRVLPYSLSISYHRGSSYTHIAWGIHNRTFDGRSL
jgi:hypothetical protein